MDCSDNFLFRENKTWTDKYGDFFRTPCCSCSSRDDRDAFQTWARVFLCANFNALTWKSEADRTAPNLSISEELVCKVFSPGLLLKFKWMRQVLLCRWIFLSCLNNSFSLRTFCGDFAGYCCRIASWSIRLSHCTVEFQKKMDTRRRQLQYFFFFLLIEGTGIARPVTYGWDFFSTQQKLPVQLSCVEYLPKVHSLKLDPTVSSFFSSINMFEGSKKQESRSQRAKVTSLKRPIWSLTREPEVTSFVTRLASHQNMCKSNCWCLT